MCKRDRPFANYSRMNVQRRTPGIERFSFVFGLSENRNATSKNARPRRGVDQFYETIRIPDALKINKVPNGPWISALIFQNEENP